MAKITRKKVYVIYRWYVVDPQTQKELNYVGYAQVDPPGDTWLKSQQITQNMEFYTMLRAKNPPVQKKNKFADAIRKYGAQAFRYEILDTVAIKKDALQKKGDWIDHFNSCLEGLNTGRGRRSEQRIYQYDLNGILVAEYDSVTDASKTLNIHIDVILMCLKGKLKSVNGFRFTYRDK